MRARQKFISTFNPIQHGITVDWDSQQVQFLFFSFSSKIVFLTLFNFFFLQHVWEHLFELMEVDVSELPLVLSEVH
jgi:hypothetical protein